MIVHTLALEKFGWEAIFMLSVSDTYFGFGSTQGISHYIPLDQDMVSVYLAKKVGE